MTPNSHASDRPVAVETGALNHAAERSSPQPKSAA